VTDAPDHREPVTFACRCGVVLALPPAAAEAARPVWERLHRGPNHGPVADLAVARNTPRQTFEAFIAAAGRLKE